MVMISGAELGAALTTAMGLKNVGPKEVADHFGVKPPSVKDWQKRGCIHKRHLGRLVAYFADVVPPGHWGADPEELSAFSTRSEARSLVAAEKRAEYSGFANPQIGAKTFPMAPVLEWARLGVDLLRANSEWPASDLKAVPTNREVSARVKWVPVVDDVLGPKLLIGDLVAIDPDGTPKRDEVALFLTPQGDFLLRRWRPLIGDTFEAYDAHGNSLDSSRHGLTCVGVLVGLYREKI